jgi:uncharacterized protein (TIGR00369 family)
VSGADLLSLVPFAGELGMRLDSVERDEVRGRLRWAEELCTAGGLLHGGALMSFADTLGAACAYVNLPEGATTTTVESKTNFFRGVRGGEVLGTTRPLHVGRSFVVVQTDLVDDEGKRVAQVTQTQAVLRQEG